MKIVFAPSGRRMIPYPPCGPAVLEAAASPLVDTTVVDLEMLMWHEHQRGTPVPMYDGDPMDPWAILQDPLPAGLCGYQDLLFARAGLAAGEHLAISVMGYEQLASALLLMRRALEGGSRVIMGGQFFSMQAASQLLLAARAERLTVTVGDGFNAIRQWLQDAGTVPENSHVLRGGALVAGPAGGGSEPPVPHYRSVDWSLYEGYAAKVFKDRRPVRRAHVYVWDKKCPFRCTFCRVSSGSDAKLTKPSQVAALYASLLEVGATQFNFMTNELNPSKKYLKGVLAEMEKIPADLGGAAWFTYLRPDPIDAQDFVRLRRVGCRLVRYGVETGSQRLSDLMKKDYKIDVISRVLHDAAAADLFNHVNLLVGFPGETDDDVDRTIEFLRANLAVIHSIRINPFYLPPGSPMSDAPERNNIKLIRFDKGFWEFDVLRGEKTTPAAVKARIERLVGWCMDHGLGFAATLPFETLNILSMHATRGAALEHMREHYPFFWRVANSDSLKAHFGGYGKTEVSWDATIYRRDRNYNVVLCND
ncbi:MAG: radical SAM protein [Pseudomonadota bacterium]